MSMTDPIADFLTRIRNAQMAQLPTVSCPSSKIKEAISKVLQDEGYIAGYAIEEEDGKPTINVELKYFLHPQPLSCWIDLKKVIVATSVHNKIIGPVKQTKCSVKF